MRKIWNYRQVLIVTLAFCMSGCNCVNYSTTEKNAIDIPKAAPNLIYRGKANMILHGNTTANIVYDYYKYDNYKEKLILCSAPNEKHPIVTYEYYPEVHQQFLTSIYTREFRDDGEFICTEWSWGAGSCRLIIFKLNDSGKFEIVFDHINRGGYMILNVLGTKSINICGGNGYSQKKMEIYKYEGGKFVLAKVLNVERLHQYMVKNGSNSSLEQKAGEN